MMFIQRSSRSLLILLGVAASGASGCYEQPDAAELRIKVIDNSNPQAPQPMSGVIVMIETGGIYVRNPDPSRGSPAYQYGARGSDEGTVFMTLPTDTLGIHTYATGYYYGARLVEFDQELGVTINMEPFRSPAPPLPTITNATISPATVAPGAEFTISADVQTGDPDDPLSDEVLVAIPALDKGHALNPPSAGVQGVGFPDGTWSIQLVAPSEPGSYAHYLSVTTEHCVTGDIGPPLVLEVQ